MQFTYHLAIVGGTFDHFHKGHEELLRTSFEKSERVIIGISKPALYKHKLLGQFIESYEVRKQQVTKYLAKKGWLPRATFIPIEDIYGNSLEVPEIEVIIVTKENLPAVKIINNKRKEIGCKPLQIEVIPNVLATDGTLITSERIRTGEMDREGFVYAGLFAHTQQLVLPESMRTTLQKPLGNVETETKHVVSSLQKDTVVIAVGDIVAAKLSENNYTPAIRIIDQMNRRQKITEVLFQKGSHANNPHGTIQTEAVQTIRHLMDDYLKTRTSHTLIITGEEDLLALPTILFAPLGAVVLYGQYGKGVVVNAVTESLKQKVKHLLEKFE